MTQYSRVRTRKMRIIARDPSVKEKNRILTALVDVPAEDLLPGPWGCRVQVVDYDASTGTLIKPLDYKPSSGRIFRRPVRGVARLGRFCRTPVPRAECLRDRHEDARPVRVRARPADRLGIQRPPAQGRSARIRRCQRLLLEERRRVVLRLFPRSRGERCSVACRTTSSRTRRRTRSSTACASDIPTRRRPIRPRFHEGFADVVALLSVFALAGRGQGPASTEPPGAVPREPAPNLVALDDADCRERWKSVLLGLAEEMGQEMAAVRGQALRQSAMLEPSPKYSRTRTSSSKPHRRGEILVAAMMNAFIEVWAAG